MPTATSRASRAGGAPASASRRLLRFLLLRHRELMLGAAWSLAALGLPAWPDRSPFLLEKLDLAAQPWHRPLLAAAYAALVALPVLTLWLDSWLNRKEVPPRPRRGPFLEGLAASLALAFPVQLSGGLSSPLWPGYFVILAVAAFAGRRFPSALALAAVIVLLEASALLAVTSFAPDAATLWRLAGSGTALLAVTAVVAWASRALRRKADASERELATLRADAASLIRHGVEGEDGPLAPQTRERTGVGMALERDEKLRPIIKLAAEAMGADACGLFLLDEAGEGLRLHLVHPDPGTPVPAAAIPLAGDILGSVLHSGEPLAIGRLGRSAGQGSYLCPGRQFLSLAAAPVAAPLGAPIGVLAAEAARADAFAEKKELLKGFARQVIETFLTSQQAARTEVEGRKQDATIQVSNALARCLKDRDIVRTLLEETGAVMGFRTAAFFTVGEGERVTLRMARGLPAEAEGRTYDVRRCLLGYLVAHRQPFIFDDLQAGKRRAPVVSGLDLDCRSLLAVPLVTDERLTGIFLAADPEPGRFDQTHLDILRLLANQTAVQLTNAALHERMEQMAVTDGLTGLFNHRHFHERLAEELVRVKRQPAALSVIILDIDHFKKVNDTYGHPFGDVVLKGVSRLLSTLAREADLVARYGGEEMALLLVNTNRRGAETMATRVLKGVRQLRFPFRDLEVKITASLGSSTYPEDAATASELVHAADEALYRSKNEGRDRYTPAGARERVRG